MKMFDKIPVCEHSNRNVLDQYLLLSLENLERWLKVDLVFTSGLRCEACNTAAGGVPGSAHISGKAVDIKIANSHQRHDLLRAVFALQFSRVGIGKTFIHVDVDTDKPQQVCWLY